MGEDDPKRLFAQAFGCKHQSCNLSDYPGSLYLDPCRRDDRPPFLDLGFLIAVKRLRRLLLARENLLSHVREPLTHLRVSQGVDRGVEFVPLGALNPCRLPPSKNGDFNAPARQSQARMIRSARKAKELGYPHEPWTTRPLASHAREHVPRMGMAGSPSWPRAPCARSSMSRRQSPTRCTIT
jgi:hypothetical protein